MPITVYDQKPQGERLRPCAGDQVRLTNGKHGIRGKGACGAKGGVHRFRSGHPQILGQEAAEMAGARTFVFVRRAPAYRDRQALEDGIAPASTGILPSAPESARAPLTITARCRSSSRQVLPPQRAAPPPRTRPSLETRGPKAAENGREIVSTG